MPAPDPLSMSLAEKLACEWEARHDVAARRRGGDPAPLQHYLTHVRCEDARSPARRRAAERPARPVPAPRSPLSDWVRWGEEGRAGSPVIPRC
ncbi:hypothetical protein [Blastococcus sp. SYSU D00820]